MKPGAWILIAAAAAIAVLAWRFGRSRLARGLALDATVLAGLGLLFAALGYGGCHERGTCGPVGEALRVVLDVATVALFALLVAGGARALWRRRPGVRTTRAPRPRPRPRRLRGDGPRMRRRDVFLGLFGLAMLAGAFAVLAFGQREDRVGSLPMLFFALALLVVPVSGRLAARTGLRPGLERVEHDGALQPALVIPGSAVKLRLMRWGALCFAVAGLGLALEGAVLVGSISAGFFGLGALLSARHAGRPWRIVLLPGGLRWELGSAPVYVAWADVTRVGTFAINDTWFLGLDARAGAVRMPPRWRWLARANRVVSGCDASLSLEAFPVEPDRLAAVVSACAASPERRREIGTERSLAWLAEAPRREVTASWSTA